ncbi:MAG: LysR family transcriptional regulator, partial [Clostridia bacterium]|nr:LysR family transcriptional regulator [Clostridia bacterium]
METGKIKVILAAVESKSLSKAANEFSYTPSALSHMADSLEEELGIKLLERSTQGISLTEEGEQLYGKLIRVCEAEEELMQAAKQLAKKNADILRIGCYSSISMNLLPKILKPFKEQYPEITVSIAVRNTLHGWLDEGNADVIFADDVALKDSDGVFIIDDPFVAVMPQDTLPGQKSIGREQLYDYTYISTSQTVLQKYFDISRFKETVQFDSVDDMSVISMVKEGIGIAVLPRLVA